MSIDPCVFTYTNSVFNSGWIKYECFETNWLSGWKTIIFNVHHIKGIYCACVLVSELNIKCYLLYVCNFGFTVLMSENNCAKKMLVYSHVYMLFKKYNQFVCMFCNTCSDTCLVFVCMITIINLLGCALFKILHVSFASDVVILSIMNLLTWLLLNDYL